MLYQWLLACGYDSFLVPCNLVGPAVGHSWSSVVTNPYAQDISNVRVQWCGWCACGHNNQAGVRKIIWISISCVRWITAGLSASALVVPNKYFSCIVGQGRAITLRGKGASSLFIRQKLATVQNKMIRRPAHAHALSLSSEESVGCLCCFVQGELWTGR